MATSIQVYPSPQWPSIPDGTPLRKAIAILERIEVSLRKEAQPVTKNLDRLQISYEPVPTEEQAVREVKKTLAAATGDLPAAEVARLLDLIRAIK